MKPAADRRRRIGRRPAGRRRGRYRVGSSSLEATGRARPAPGVPWDRPLLALSWAGAVVPWVLYAVGGHAAGDSRRNIIVSIVAFAVPLLVRLGLVITTLPVRRRSNVVLWLSCGAWSAAALWLYVADESDLSSFPHPPELLFLASYIGFATHLILDARSRHTDSASSWLESIVLCGGAASVAAAIFLQPLANSSGRSGLALFTALLYPCLDLALLLVVVVQLTLRNRVADRYALAVTTGWGLFLVADSGFLINVSGTSVFQAPAFGAGLWFVAMVLMTVNAGRPADRVRAGRRRFGAIPMLIAAGAAIAVLVVRPLERSGPYIVPIAVLTLVAAAGRMTLALREANGAAEAFALSRTDDLTLLPNRRAVLSRVDGALGTGEPLALMLFDLDGFKEINDTLGHSAGDTVLQIAANRVREGLPQETLVARLGGDEFAAVFSTTDPAVLMRHARELLATLADSMTVDGMTLSVSASIGVTVSDPSDVSSTDLLRRADVAMYQAKQDRAGVLIYDPTRDDFSRQKLQLAEDLRRGIGQGQLRVYYQPQVDAQTRQLHGVEALIRWLHPQLGLLSPAEFLPVARRAGLMLPVSELVLAVAVADMQQWHSRGLDLRVSINVAPAELLSRTFLPQLFKACEQGLVPPDRLVVEVTEDSFLAEPGRARDILAEIREHRVEIAIDDYGTGFSSLSYLRDLPVNELKIDRSFVKAMQRDPRSHTIVYSTVQMATALGLRTVAEGVEDEATMQELAAVGVDLLQGYAAARPMPAAELVDWLLRWQDLPATREAVRSAAERVAR